MYLLVTFQENYIISIIIFIILIIIIICGIGYLWYQNDCEEYEFRRCSKETIEKECIERSIENTKLLNSINGNLEKIVKNYHL
jgi:hypothetical protein